MHICSGWGWNKGEIGAGKHGDGKKPIIEPSPLPSRVCISTKLKCGVDLDTVTPVWDSGILTIPSICFGKYVNSKYSHSETFQYQKTNLNIVDLCSESWVKEIIKQQQLKKILTILNAFNECSSSFCIVSLRLLIVILLKLLCRTFQSQNETFLAFDLHPHFSPYSFVPTPLPFPFPLHWAFSTSQLLTLWAKRFLLVQGCQGMVGCTQHCRALPIRSQHHLPGFDHRKYYQMLKACFWLARAGSP